MNGSVRARFMLDIELLGVSPGSKRVFVRSVDTLLPNKVLNPSKPLNLKRLTFALIMLVNFIPVTSKGDTTSISHDTADNPSFHSAVVQYCSRCCGTYCKRSSKELTSEIITVASSGGSITAQGALLRPA